MSWGTSFFGGGCTMPLTPTDAYSLSPPAQGVSGAEDESVSEFKEGMRLLELAQGEAK